MLGSIPELEGLAIVPTFVIANPQLPVAFVTGKTGPLRTPDEVMHMTAQLHATLVHMLHVVHGVIQSYDQEMGRLATALRTVTETILPGEGGSGES